MKVKPLTLNIEKSVWLEFCKYVPDTRKKNGTIVELIKKYNEARRNENRLFIPKN